MILHVDGDSFFASCEASLDHTLRGKPVVTGQERGIASAMSKEAKALGITRGMPIYQVRKLYPQVVVRASDYTNYEIFSQRMYSIVARYADVVEEYSIDECFAEITAPDAEKVIKNIKHDLQSELGMTFSLGLAPTKVLAKLASSKSKPDGLTILKTKEIDKFLGDIDVGKIWGIGPARARSLRDRGVKTALDLKIRPVFWAKDALDKHTFEIWEELNAIKVYNVSPSGGEEGEEQKSIQATRTFTPPVTDKDTLLSELSKNIENASVKAREQGLAATRIYYFLKTQEFRYHRRELMLATPLENPSEMMPLIRSTFGSVYRPNLPYRATGVTLAGLRPASTIEDDLFGSRGHSKIWDKVYEVVDELDKRYGSHSVVLASSLGAYKRRRDRGFTKRLKIPFIGEVR